MKIAVLYNDIDIKGSREDEADCLMQMQEISTILSSLGHDAVRLPFRDSLSHMEADLKALSPDCVFNLVETAMGSDSQLYIVPQKLEEIRIPYTGCRAEALKKLSNKQKEISQDDGANENWIHGVSTIKNCDCKLHIKFGCGAIIKFAVKSREYEYWF